MLLQPVGQHFACKQDVRQASVYLLDKKLSTIDFGTLSEVGFECFDQYFRLANGLEGRLLHYEGGSDFTVLDFGSLAGVESLWKIALHAKQQSVSLTATHYLNSLYEKVDYDICKLTILK
jgi:hypothetical protein